MYLKEGKTEVHQITRLRCQTYFVIEFGLVEREQKMIRVNERRQLEKPLPLPFPSIPLLNNQEPRFKSKNVVRIENITEIPSSPKTQNISIELKREQRKVGRVNVIDRFR
ncbi:5995_t:CDS:2 [Acaulospora morrowiae]|uniref:5995_t:CDS:1 n=1 Tax=Acaulospora morrowiae TaxID=94023 RepID=A0A9N8WDD5_9GLOM|nr:5995_t:CDS:2 [Acaulospora morrowiae]